MAKVYDIDDAPTEVLEDTSEVAMTPTPNQPNQESVPVLPPAPTHVTYWSQPYLRSRTFWINILLLVPPILDLLVSMATNDPTLIPPNILKLLLIAAPIANLVLRKTTVRPMTFTVESQPVQVKLIKSSQAPDSST